jgi:hypothetical protein
MLRGWVAITRTFCLCALACFASCASPPPAGSRVNFIQPPSDRAFIYIYRNQTPDYPQARIKLQFDGEPAGSTIRESFTLLKVSPGQHTITSGSYADGLPNWDDSFDLRLSLLGGEVVYLWQELLVGTNLTSELHRVSRQEGREGVLKCRLTDDLAPSFLSPSEESSASETSLSAGPRTRRKP